MIDPTAREHAWTIQTKASDENRAGELLDNRVFLDRGVADAECTKENANVEFECYEVVEMRLIP